MMQEVPCPFCHAANAPDVSVCANCQRSLVVGKLTSLGTGVLPKGFVWEMRPATITLGRHIGCDFVIPSNLIAGDQLRFEFTGSGFTVRDLEGRGRCFVEDEVIDGEQPIEHHNRLRVGVEEFLYTYIAPSDERVTKIPDPLAAALQLTLGIISEFHASLNIQELVDNALDAILRLTRTKRAYAFLVEEPDEGEMELREIAARAPGGKALDSQAGEEEEEGISHSLVREVLSGSELVIIEDAAAQKVSSDTVSRLKLRTIICAPLVTYDPQTGKKRVMGVLYADSLRPVGELPPHCRPTLQMLVQIIVATINKWQTYTNMQEQFDTFERSVEDLYRDLEVAAGEIHQLEERVGEGPAFDQIDREGILFHLNAVDARIQTAQTNLQRLMYMRRRVL
jgi:hypothetical protein